MTPRQLFTGLLALSLGLSACSSVTPQPTLLPPTAPPATVSPAPLPASPTPAVEVASSPTAAPPTPAPVSFPDPAAYLWAPVINGLAAPTDIRSAGDGSGRLFIVEQPGRIRILKNGQLNPAPFLDITGRVGSRGSEQGLLGLAFHPKFSQNGYFYVNYTDRDGNTHISRFTASGDDADPASEMELLGVRQPFANHNGGALA